MGQVYQDGHILAPMGGHWTEVLGGLGLFLFGMSVMTDGLRGLAGRLLSTSQRGSQEAPRLETILMDRRGVPYLAAWRNSET
ncbi:MAG: hypothetical protein D6720_03345 [Gammaproteobacteria bacterium]|nr:MAG: hypothetical protein D6720_03345 [Gammaproteobacteria bacterium]